MFQKALLLATFFCIAEVARAQDLLTTPSLKDVNRVTLTVYAFGGLDKESISKLASQGLKAAKVDVVSKTPSSPSASLPMLNLVVTLTCAKEACGYTTHLWLEEPVRLVRHPSSIAKATTWSNGYQNAISKADMASLPSLISVDVMTLLRLYAAEVSGQIQ